MLEVTYNSIQILQKIASGAERWIHNRGIWQPFPWEKKYLKFNARALWSAKAIEGVLRGAIPRQKANDRVLGQTGYASRLSNLEPTRPIKHLIDLEKAITKRFFFSTGGLWDLTSQAIFTYQKISVSEERGIQMLQ